jgi:hypothetical protein
MTVYMRLLLHLVGWASLSAFAQTDLPPYVISADQFATFRREADAFNLQDPFANAYRAGHYNGYVAGIIDSQQGKSICFRDCPCVISQLVERHLKEIPQDANRHPTEWLTPLLQSRYPCR